MKTILIALITGCSLLVSPGAKAQTYDLVPENWFPLELGSTWHYRYESGALTWNEVRKADRDTLIDGYKWVGISTVFCPFTPGCPAGLNTKYYRFVEDGYLLSYRSKTGRSDTFDVTYPYSIFNVSTAIDTLYSGFYGDSIVVRIDSTDFGNVIDSTNLYLGYRYGLYGGSGSHYLYKIGDARYLVGATVGSITVGDTDFLTRVSMEDKATIPAGPIIEFYPHPMKSTGTIRIKRADAGLHTVTMFDLLGRQIARTQFMGSRQEGEIFFKEQPESSGYYLLIVETPSGQKVSTSMVYIND